MLWITPCDGKWWVVRQRPDGFWCNGYWGETVEAAAYHSSWRGRERHFGSCQEAQFQHPEAVLWVPSTEQCLPAS